MKLQEVTERDKLQFDYAWKWFESHQKQRMVMFYYYCIMVGVLANALVASYKGCYHEIWLAIGIMGTMTSLASLFFDKRNRGMCKVAEDILEKLENEVIFPPDFVDEKGNKMGPISVDSRFGMREGQPFRIKHIFLKHKWWIRGMEVIVALCFLLVAIEAMGRVW